MPSPQEQLRNHHGFVMLGALHVQASERRDGTVWFGLNVGELHFSSPDGPTALRVDGHITLFYAPTPQCGRERQEAAMVVGTQIVQRASARNLKTMVSANMDVWQPDYGIFDLHVHCSL
ncbi:MAG: hypothetical protein GY772_12050, partial [bacterium]|nr:hypothetical protein [bacterium]